MFFAPLSELYGRRILYVTTLLIGVLFVIPGAVAKNIATLLVARAIDGIGFRSVARIVIFTSRSLFSYVQCPNDHCRRHTRRPLEQRRARRPHGMLQRRALPRSRHRYAASSSRSPPAHTHAGPLVGGFIADNKGWRWLYWIQLIVGGFVYVLMTLTVPETYAPTILLKRARRLRKETGDTSYVTEQEIDRRPLSEEIGEFILRPYQLLFTELIVFLIALYMSVLYGLLYMFFVACVPPSCSAPCDCDADADAVPR